MPGESRGRKGGRRPRQKKRRKAERDRGRRERERRERARREEDPKKDFKFQLIERASHISTVILNPCLIQAFH